MQERAPTQAAAGADALVIGDAVTVRGFALAGFRTVVAETPEEVASAWSRVRADPPVLVVLTERAAEAVQLEPGGGTGGVRPLVAVIPAAAGARVSPSPGARLRRLVRRSLGLPADARSEARPAEPAGPAEPR